MTEPVFYKFESVGNFPDGTKFQFDIQDPTEPTKTSSYVLRLRSSTTRHVYTCPSKEDPRKRVEGVARAMFGSDCVNATYITPKGAKIPCTVKENTMVMPCKTYALVIVCTNDYTSPFVLVDTLMPPSKTVFPE